MLAKIPCPESHVTVREKVQLYKNAAFGEIFKFTNTGAASSAYVSRDWITPNRDVASPISRAFHEAPLVVLS
jgi:hypothetical protein